MVGIEGTKAEEKSIESTPEGCGIDLTLEGDDRLPCHGIAEGEAWSILVAGCS